MFLGQRDLPIRLRRAFFFAEVVIKVVYRMPNDFGALLTHISRNSIALMEKTIHLPTKNPFYALSACRLLTRLYPAKARPRLLYSTDPFLRKVGTK